MQLHTIKLHISKKCLQPCRRRALGIVVKESNHLQIRSIYVFEMSSMICLDWLRKNYVARSSPDDCPIIACHKAAPEIVNLAPVDWFEKLQKICVF